MHDEIISEINDVAPKPELKMVPLTSRRNQIEVPKLGLEMQIRREKRT